jgi:hypothetical protein
MKTFAQIFLVFLLSCCDYKKEASDPNADCMIVFIGTNDQNEIGVCLPLYVENQCDIWIRSQDTTNLVELLFAFEVALKSVIYQKSKITIEIHPKDAPKEVNFEILKKIKSIVNAADKRKFRFNEDKTGRLHTIDWLVE